MIAGIAPACVTTQPDDPNATEGANVDGFEVECPEVPDFEDICDDCRQALIDCYEGPCRSQASPGECVSATLSSSRCECANASSGSFMDDGADSSSGTDSTGSSGSSSGTDTEPMDFGTFTSG